MNKEAAIAKDQKELDSLKFSNTELDGQNRDYTAEIEALKAHIKVLDGENVDLNNELERFVRADEEIRHTLDRRGHVQDIHQHQEVELHRSKMDLERASPRRFR
jgi:chromosome segregation ATPase